MTPPNVGEDVEKTNPLYSADGKVKWDSYSGRQFDSFFKKLNIQLPYNPAIALLGIYPEN